MASKTTNYGLNKHSPQDFYNVEARNENWDKIDEALAAADPTKITAKAAPADGDGVMIADSADGGKAKRLQWLNVKAALGKLFVPLARKINGKTLTEDVTLTAADIKMPDSEEDVGAAMAKRLGYNDNLGTGINLKEHVKYEYLSLDGSKDSELNGSGGCLILPGWRSGPWGMQMRFDMRWNALFIRRYRDEATLWDDWERLAICAPPEVHGLPLASGFPAQSYANTYYKTQEGIVHLNFCIFRGESTAFVERETICTMPEGYRPSTVIAAAVGGDGKSFGNGLPTAELHIEPDGQMWFYGADTRINWVYGEITYLAG